MAHISSAMNAMVKCNKLEGHNGYIIGFGGKMYTLWTYQFHYNDAGEKTHCEFAYIKIISKDREIAKLKYENAPVDETLKGSHWNIKCSPAKPEPHVPHVPQEKRWDEFESLPFGKYAGTACTQVRDCSYWCWLANQKWEDARWETPEGDYVYLKPLYEKMALENGGEKLNGRWYDPNEERPWIKIQYDFLKKNFDKILRNEEFSFVPESNGCGFRLGDIDIVFKPEDTYTFYTYYGGGSFLKVTDKKGNKVNKRTKGKTITIKDYELIKAEVDDRTFYRVNVNSFELK